jgi:predicted outer membrane protein
LKERSGEGPGVLRIEGAGWAFREPLMRKRSATMIGVALLGSAAATAACSTSNRDTNEAAGEVTLPSTADTTSAKPTVRWLSDANLLALLGVMNARQMAAADIELESWHVDSVRAFAASVAREHAELQHSVDSLSERIHVAPVTPALAQTVSSTMQSQIDIVRRTYGRALDRVFIRQQVASYDLMSDYIGEFAAVAERPEVQSLLSSTKQRVRVQLTHARAIQTRLAVADSTAAADSAAKLAARLASKRERRSSVP